MTSFLTFSVTAVRISSDIPTQSEYLPLITLYMVLSMVYTLIGLICFILIESFTKSKKIPAIFLKVPFCVKKIKQSLKKNNQVIEFINKVDKTTNNDLKGGLQVKDLTGEVGQHDEIKSNSKENSSLSQNQQILSDLFRTLILNQRQEDEKKEEDAARKLAEEKKKSNELEENVAILNGFFFIMLSSIVFGCSLTIWIYSALLNRNT